MNKIKKCAHFLKFEKIWNEKIKLEVKGYSKYHTDAVVEELGSEPWRLSCIYGEAQVLEGYRTWDTLKSIASSHGS